MLFCPAATASSSASFSSTGSFSKISDIILLQDCHNSKVRKILLKRNRSDSRLLKGKQWHFPYNTDLRNFLDISVSSIPARGQIALLVTGRPERAPSRRHTGSGSSRDRRRSGSRPSRRRP